MPLKEPYRDFQDGDLVYGIEERQGRRGFIVDNSRAKVPATIDEFEPIKGEGETPSKDDQASFLKTLSEHPKYKTANIDQQTYMKFLVSDGGDPKANQAVRRKDKMGLYWCTKVASKHVHFVLDGIDQKAVVEKTFKSDKPQGKPEDGEKGYEDAGHYGIRATLDLSAARRSRSSEIHPVLARRQTGASALETGRAGEAMGVLHPDQGLRS